MVPRISSAQVLRATSEKAVPCSGHSQTPEGMSTVGVPALLLQSWEHLTSQSLLIYKT